MADAFDRWWSPLSGGRSKTRMSTRRLSSHTREHPTPKDVSRALLSRRIEGGNESSWTHLEAVAEGGWLKNLLYGKEPWIEGL